MLWMRSYILNYKRKAHLTKKFAIECAFRAILVPGVCVSLRAGFVYPFTLHRLILLVRIHIVGDILTIAVFRPAVYTAHFCNKNVTGLFDIKPIVFRESRVLIFLFSGLAICRQDLIF